MNLVSQEKIIQNLKILKIMKATGYKDSEIATAIGVTTRDLLDCISADDYLQEIYDHAGDKIASEIERKFLDKVLSKLDEGDTNDAKWVLERTTEKYSRKENIKVSGELTIDEIIREQTKDDKK